MHTRLQSRLTPACMRSVRDLTTTASPMLTSCLRRTGMGALDGVGPRGGTMHMLPFETVHVACMVPMSL